MSAQELSLQVQFAPENRCFGCGPANERGLHVESFPEGEGVVCVWTPAEHHQAWENMLNGGICGTILDCHSDWAAAWYMMQRDGLEGPPCMVTADFHVKLLAPTPMDGPLTLHAQVIDASARRATVEATLEASGVVTATCRGNFVAVREGHPAYHRW